MNRYNSAEWEQISELFEKAALLEGADRDSFLEGISNPSWREEIVSLLGFGGQEDDFLDDVIKSDLVFDLFNHGHAKFSPGETVGDFVIQRVLGSGSFGTVYLAIQKSLERVVALKVSPALGDEGKTLATLEHDHIVKVYSETIDQSKNFRLICMQYVDGPTLEMVLIGNHSSFDVNSFLKFAIQVTQALDHAHERGVIHLDIKPDNILLNSSGRPFLADFNISANRKSQRGGLYGGTISYMSPEQQAALESQSKEAFDRLDERSDIYSLGIVLRRAVATCPQTSLVRQHIYPLLERCTASDPKARVQSAKELERLFAACHEFQRIEEQLPASGPLVRFASRFPIITLVLAILVPNVVGSIVNIAYNAMRIVGHLSEEQQDLFRLLIMQVNPVTYSISIFLLVKYFMPLLKYFVRRPALAPAELERLRRQVILCPVWVVAVCSLGWVTSSITFPLMLHLKAGPITGDTVFHFQVSFFLSLLISSTYAFLNVQYFGLRVVYPQLWSGCHDISATAQKELGWFVPKARFFQFLAGLVPLFAAALMVIVGPESLGTKSYEVYRFLLLKFIAMSAAGFAFSLTATKQISQIYFAFTGKE